MVGLDAKVPQNSLDRKVSSFASCLGIFVLLLDLDLELILFPKTSLYNLMHPPLLWQYLSPEGGCLYSFSSREFAVKNRSGPVRCQMREIWISDLQNTMIFFVCLKRNSFDNQKNICVLETEKGAYSIRAPIKDMNKNYNLVLSRGLL